MNLILRKMEMIATGRSGEPITGMNEMPPCFDSYQQYKDWLESVDPELGSPVPVRKDWPGEPNYCRDCTREHRNRMRSAGRCLFPRTVFVEFGEGEDRELVGVSRGDRP